MYMYRPGPKIKLKNNYSNQNKVAVDIMGGMIHTCQDPRARSSQDVRDAGVFSGASPL